MPGHRDTAGVITRRIIVVGRVQGVWFRGATAMQARGLGIRGHAHNLPDGSVEVLAVGSAASIDELVAWLWQGPPMAEVRDVRVEQAGAGTGDAPSGFTTG